MQPHQAGAELSASSIYPQQLGALYSNHTYSRHNQNTNRVIFQQINNNIYIYTRALKVEGIAWLSNKHACMGSKVVDLNQSFYILAGLNLPSIFPFQQPYQVKTQTGLALFKSTYSCLFTCTTKRLKQGKKGIAQKTLLPKILNKFPLAKP